MLLFAVFITTLAFGHGAVASVIDVSDLQERSYSPKACQQVDKVIVALKKIPESSFCSKWLHIVPHASTTRVVVHTETSITAVITITHTETNSLTVTSLSTSTDLELITQTITTDAITGTVVIPSAATTTATLTFYTKGARAQLPERNIAARSRYDDCDLPKELRKFHAREVSSACSCLHLPTRTVIVTSKITAYVKTATSTTSISTVTSTLTDTSDIVVTILSTNTKVITSTPMATSTSISTRTTVVSTTIDPCATPLSYNCGTIQKQGSISSFFGLTGQECCDKCFFDTPNCAMAYSVGDGSDSFCDITVTDPTTLTPGTESGTCPAGITYNNAYACPEPDFEAFIYGPCFLNGPPVLG